MAHGLFDGDKGSLSSPSFALPDVRIRRLIAVLLAGAVLGLLSATACAEPNVATPPPRAAGKEVAGTLMIVGGGKMPAAVLQRFLELAGGEKGRLVVIPTASSRIEKISRYWKSQKLASVTMLHTLDPKEADDPLFVKPLTEATAAWLSGGDQSRLANVYRGTAVERELRRLLQRGGVVGGTSAGAAVMSRIMITGGKTQARLGAGFGLLPDVVIDQHFENRKRQQRLLGVLAQHPDYLGIGIDEQTAVIVRGHTFTVLGNANVLLCLPPSAREPASINKVLKSGENGDLSALSRAVLARRNSALPKASKEPTAAKVSSSKDANAP